MRPWTKHAGKNCYGGRGATDLPSAAGKVGLAACQAACLALAGCEGIVLPTTASGKDRSGVGCYRRKNVELSKCSTSTAYETHLLAPLPPHPPSAPAPPAPPPRPVAPPSSADAINAAMATERGVLVHLLDNYIFVNGDQTGRAGRSAAYSRLGTISGSIIMTKQRPEPRTMLNAPSSLSAECTTESCYCTVCACYRQRARFGSKLPVYDINDAGRYGGIVIRQEAVTIKCLYGGDIGSWNVVGGCNDKHLGWCDDDYADASRTDPCGGLPRGNKLYRCECCTKFTSSCSPTSYPPWRGEHIRTFLDFHSRFGGHPSCCGSGYNEAIIAGGDEWNGALPASIAAFFYDVDRARSQWSSTPKHVRALRDGFVKHYDLRADDVPLLEFNRRDFVTPFKAVDGGPL